VSACVCVVCVRACEWCVRLRAYVRYVRAECARCGVRGEGVVLIYGMSGICVVSVCWVWVCVRG